MTNPGQVRLDGIVKRHGDFSALRGIDLEIEPGEFFALLGPSGSGKSTTLRILAGLDMPTSGRVIIDGADVTSVAPSDRDVAMVFQSYALYPHMSVFQNIAFPLEMGKAAKGAIQPKVREAARKVRIDHLLDRKPGQLSGGQQQRVALARAIVREPRLFLLDEPLSNLDAKLRLETRFELKKLQRTLGVTTVYVTHDQEEAMTLADRMAVFMEGEVKQIGRPADIFARPNSIDVAAFIGSPPMNLIPASYSDGYVIVADYPLKTSCRIPGQRDVIVGIRPGALRFGRDGMPANVGLIEDLGDMALLDLEVGGIRMRARVRDGTPPREGDVIHVAAQEKDLHLFDRATGARIESQADAA
jgi:ABC-type sugar transport system ATPase subunit